MEFRYKIWLESDGKVFGDGPYDLLQRVDKLGSLSGAAREINMSYSQAWELINGLEQRLGFKLLDREIGGRRGGGSFLTAEARDLMAKYANFAKDSEAVLKELYRKHFGSKGPGII